MNRPFNAAAIPKCRERISKAKAALYGCENAHNFAEFESHWNDLLIHCGGAINLIESGSRDTPQGRQWYGGIKREFNGDELLKYMFQARNAIEHDFRDVVWESNASMQSVCTTGGNINFEDGIPMWGSNEEIPFGSIVKNPDAAIIQITPSGPKLLAVENRKFGDIFRPPSMHLGRPIPEISPRAVGALYISYIESLLARAAELA